ncbi:putative ribosome-binding factor A, mitochondrial isoform X2 [Apus apus]|uniref:putative ribosome-binding factor A, mitochondrial isoform X2 n=1 Tax=Apus apus TaxID=8895 RepID=UPI0021F8C5DD|nr:putative ribosome-binding factor A, mitochondrial isoform X2 [Apus apus]
MWGGRAVAGAARRAREAAVPRGSRALRTSAARGGSRDLLRKMLRKKKKKLWYDSPILGSKMVSLASNFSACRVYWNPAATTEKESYVESVLRRSAPRIRYLLTSQQILGNVPPIVFVKDKEAAAVKEIEELLSVADFGPSEEEETSQNYSSKLLSSATQSSDSPMRSNLFGIDHELLNKQIMDYKRLKVSRHLESIAWTEEQEQQLSKIQKKIKKKKIRNPPDDAAGPQEYLLDRYEADYWDDNTGPVSDCELEDELQEEVNKLEGDDDKTKHTNKLK